MCFTEKVLTNKIILVKRPLTKRVSIYVLKHPVTNEIRYVGKTLQDLQVRLKQHCYDKTKDRKSNWIQSLIKQDLKPHIEEIEKCTDENWQEREIYWIQHYKDLGVRLTNGNAGGLGGHKPSDEVRKKLSGPNKNKSNGQKGRVHSPETRAKMSIAAKNRSTETKEKIAISKAKRNYCHSDETRAKISKAHTDETRAKISKAHKGRKHSIEHVAKNSITHKGKKHSDETKAKIGAKSKGRVTSPETRVKQSIAAKNYHTAKMKDTDKNTSHL